ncbi:MAG: hypothetical protein LBP50_00045 [Tannerella sp.]|nr:hypothetical protein [Tannerella sp.]
MKKEASFKQGLNSQATGLSPLLLMMVLSVLYPSRISFVFTLVICTGCLVLFRYLSGKNVFLFMLLPVAITLILYSVFFYSALEPVLYMYTPLITEWLLVMVLSLLSTFRRSILRRIRPSGHPVKKQAQFRTALTEYFHVAQTVQNLYTLHFFALLFYIIFFEFNRIAGIDRFLYHQAPLLIGLMIISYEQVRLYMVKKRLEQEKWLPVLNSEGRVIGRIAYSVSLGSNAKHCHPVVRVAVVWRGMIYLTRRAADSPVSPGALDYPFRNYILFRRTPEQTIKELVERIMPWNQLNLHFLIRYPFQGGKVCSMVSLYAATMKSEDEFVKYIGKMNGKLWTRKQIEENLGKGVFSAYFEQEYPYLQNTVLLAEEYTGRQSVGAQYPHGILKQGSFGGELRHTGKAPNASETGKSLPIS